MNDSISGQSLNELLDLITSNDISHSQSQNLDKQYLVSILFKSLDNLITKKNYQNDSETINKILDAIEIIFESNLSLFNSVSNSESIYESSILQLINYLNIKNNKILIRIKESLISIINSILSKLNGNLHFKKKINFLINQFDSILNDIFKNLSSINNDIILQKLIKLTHYFTILNDFDLKNKLLIKLTNNLKFDSYKRKIWFLISSLSDSNDIYTDELKPIIVLNLYQNLINDSVLSLKNLSFLGNLINDLIFDLDLFKFPVLTKTISIKLLDLHNLCQKKDCIDNFNYIIKIHNSITFLEKNNPENNLSKSNFIKTFILIKFKTKQQLSDNERNLIHTPFNDPDLEKLRLSIVNFNPNINKYTEFTNINKLLSIHSNTFSLTSWINLLFTQLSSNPELYSDKVICLNIINALGHYSCMLSNDFNFKLNSCSKCCNLQNSNYFTILNNRQIDSSIEFRKLMDVIELLIDNKNVIDDNVLVLNLLITIFKIFGSYYPGKIDTQNKVYQFISSCLVHHVREVRLFASKVMLLYLNNAVHISDQVTSDINDFNFRIILNLINGINFNKDLYLAESTIKLWSELAIISNNEGLNLILLKLIDIIGSSNNFHSILSFHYLKLISNIKKKTAYQLLSPYMPIISLILIKQINSKPIILKRMSDLIEIDIDAIMSRNESYILPFVLTYYKFDLFEEYSNKFAMTKYELVSRNIDKIIANLIVSLIEIDKPTKLNEKRILNILGNISPEFKRRSFESLIGNSFVLAWNILKLSDSGNDEIIKNSLIIVAKIDYNLSNELSDQEALEFFLKKYMLGIIQQFSEVIHDTKGTLPYLEKIKSLKAIEILVKLSKELILSSIAQILACFQDALENKDLEIETLNCWKTLIDNLPQNGFLFIYDLTISFFLQKWDTLNFKSKLICERILKRIFNEKKILYKAKHSSYLFSIPYNPELSNFLSNNLLTLFLKEIEGSTFDGFELFINICKRLQNDNKYIVKQSLSDLINFFTRYQENFHSMMVDKLKYLEQLPNLLNSLLDTSYKFKSIDKEIPLMCSKVLGLVGSLDSNKFENKKIDHQIVIVSNFNDFTDVQFFVITFIDEVLVKAFWASIDPVKQQFLAYAIQEYLKELDLNEENIKFPKSIWNKFKPMSRSTIAHLLNSKYKATTHPKVSPKYPIFSKYKDHTEWIREFTLDLLGKSSTENSPGQNIFKIASSVIKEQDISICKFILPFAALNILLSSGNSTHAYTGLLKTEVLSVLSSPLAGLHPKSVDNVKLCYQTIFTILDYFKKWCSSIKQRNKGSKKAASRVIESFLEEIPQELMAKRSSEARYYERSILYLEQCYRLGKVDSESMIGDLNFVSTIQTMYSNIDDIDAVQGVLKKFSTRSLEDKLLEFQYNENWMVAQESFQALTFQKDESRNIENNTKLLKSLIHNELHDQALSNLQNKVSTANFNELPKEWISMGLEASIFSGRIDALQKWVFMTESVSHFHDNISSVNHQIAKSLVFLNKDNTAAFFESLDNASLSVGSSLPHSSDTTLSRIKPLLNHLHVINDLKEIVSAEREDANTSKILSARLKNITDDFHSQWFVLIYHIAASTLMASPVSNKEISKIWIECSKIARKHNRIDLATKAIMKAILLDDTDTELEYSKLLWAQGEQTRAIKAINVLRVNISPESRSNSMSKREHAAIQLKYSKWLDLSDNSSSNVIIQEYKRAIELDKLWEEPHFHLGKYYNKILDSQKSKPDYKLDLTYGNIEKNIIFNYMKAIGCGHKYLYEALPKLITIWLDFAESSKIIPSNLDKKQKLPIATERGRYLRDMIRIISENSKLIPDYCWYTAFSQILSRITHMENASRNVLIEIAAKITISYPKHALWSLFAQVKSEDSQKSAQGSIILAKVRETLGLLNDAEKLFENLLLLCKKKVSGTKKSLSISEDFQINIEKCNALVIPLKSNLQITLPANSQAAKSHNPFPQPSQISFEKFKDNVDILSSMQRPRRLFVYGSDGKSYSLLCKPNDDLRKDAKFMEFTTMLDHLLKKDYESEKRKLGIHTYAVVPLNESFGIIEWVDNVRPMRDIINYYNSVHGRRLDIAAVRSKLDSSKASGEKIHRFKEILAAHPPVLYNWFLEGFPDPSSWYSARNCFIRSCAVMSMVGYIIGLGDRHGENILFKEDTGGILHVDFDCLFEKGKTLTIPEVVPCRLTLNMTDAMGISGIEGTFRKSCEVTMSLLRANEATLMNILEGFVHDPFMEWVKSARKSSGHSNAANYAFERTRSKIRGILDDNGLPVSVQAQAETIIQQSTAVENLSQMFIGWMAFW